MKCRSKSTLASLETTAVLPLGDRIGFLLEAVFGKSANTLRTGVIIATSKSE
jgi:hypothetical protein